MTRVLRRGRLRGLESFRVVRLYGVRRVPVFVRRRRRLSLRLVLMYGGGYLNFVRRCRVAAFIVVRLAVRVVRLAVRVLRRCVLFRQFDVTGDRRALARRVRGQAYAAGHRTRGRRDGRERIRRRNSRQQREHKHKRPDDARRADRCCL